MQRTNKFSKMQLLVIGFFVLLQNADAAISGWNLTGLSGTAINGAATVAPAFPESLSPGQPTGIRITATTGASDKITYSLLSQPVPDMFTINQSTGAITFVKGVLDFEKTSTYLIRVRASHAPNSDGTVNVTLNVGNSPPAFTLKSFSKEMCDGAMAGTTVETVKAVDPGNTNVTYALSGTTNFTIGSKTGVIKVDTAKTLNMTVKKSYTLVITATDTVPATPGVGTATVSVKLKVCSGGTSAIAIAYGALLLSIIVNRL